MRFETIAVGMYQANTYLVYDETTGEGFVIDPGDMHTYIIQRIKTLSLKPAGIILTHYHIDHVGAVEGLKREYDCPIYMHKRDEAGLLELIQQGSRLFERKIGVRPDRFVNDGESLTAGQVTLKVIHTPGHTPGSICLEAVGERVIFTGDTLFADGIGRTDLRDGNEAAMRKTLIERVNRWPDDMLICPGHEEAATMGEIRARNRIFRVMVGLARR